MYLQLSLMPNNCNLQVRGWDWFRSHHTMAQHVVSLWRQINMDIAALQQELSYFRTSCHDCSSHLVHNLWTVILCAFDSQCAAHHVRLARAEGIRLYRGYRYAAQGIRITSPIICPLLDPGVLSGKNISCKICIRQELQSWPCMSGKLYTNSCVMQFACQLCWSKLSGVWPGGAALFPSRSRGCSMAERLL